MIFSANGEASIRVSQLVISVTHLKILGLLKFSPRELLTKGLRKFSWAKMIYHLRAMKQILYDLSPRIIARWPPLRRACESIV